MATTRTGATSRVRLEVPHDPTTSGRHEFNAPHTTSTTNQRVSDVLALAADLRAKEDAQKAAEAVAQIGASA